MDLTEVPGQWFLINLPKEWVIKFDPARKVWIEACSEMHAKWLDEADELAAGSGDTVTTAPIAKAARKMAHSTDERVAAATKKRR